MKREIFAILKTYIFTLFFVCIVFLFYAKLSRIAEMVTELFTSKRGLILFHSVFLIFYLLFLLIRYFIRVYKKSDGIIMFKRIFLRFFIPMFAVFIVIKYIIHTNTNEDYVYTWDHSIENTEENSKNKYAQDGKHRGMSVYRLDRNGHSQISSLVKTNVEWISLFPYLYQKDQRSKEMRTPEEVGKWTRQDSVFIHSIKEVHKKGMHVMLKPHLWMSEGWRSNIELDSDADWNTWFVSYRKNILHYAEMAALTRVELLCIGTEFKSAIKNQPEQWKILIKDIKKVFHGKLTYAANWDDEFIIVDFWDQLDYIGIQAYFPLTKNKNPNLESIKQGWNTHIEKLEAISRKYHKPILFTEIGYRNDTQATVKPWEWGSAFNVLYKKKSARTQQLAYQALFEKLWHKEWFAGGYAWEWNSSDFPIKSTPSENTIARWYGQETMPRKIH